MYECMYVCVCISMYVHMYYVCMHVMYVCMYICMYVRVSQDSRNKDLLGLGPQMAAQRHSMGSTISHSVEMSVAPPTNA